MAKRIPVDQLRGVVNMGRVAEESMDENIRISVLVDTTCPRWLGIAIRDALVPERDAFVDVKEIVARPEVKGFDVGIIVAGRSDELVCDAMRVTSQQPDYEVRGVSFESVLGEVTQLL